MPKTLKAILFVSAITPLLYGLGAAALEAFGYRGTYSDGRLLLAISFFTALSGVRLAIRRFKGKKAV